VKIKTLVALILVFRKVMLSVRVNKTPGIIPDGTFRWSFYTHGVDPSRVLCRSVQSHIAGIQGTLPFGIHRKLYIVYKIYYKCIVPGFILVVKKNYLRLKTRGLYFFVEGYSMRLLLGRMVR
jgi:hypothetical protein